MKTVRETSEAKRTSEIHNLRTSTGTICQQIKISPQTMANGSYDNDDSNKRPMLNADAFERGRSFSAVFVVFVGSG